MPPVPKPDDSHDFFVETVFGARTREPMVRVSYDGKELALINPQDAVMLAINLIQASNASITDAFLFEFMAEKTKSDQEAALMMRDFRLWRTRKNYDLNDNLLQGKNRGRKE